MSEFKKPLPFSMQCSACQKDYDARKIPVTTFQAYAGGLLVESTVDGVDITQGHESAFFLPVKEASELRKVLGQAIRHAKDLKKANEAPSL